jgi:septum formation protein
VSLFDPAGKTDTRFATTRVSFRKIEDEEIRRYIKTGEPMDKAGAYAIQGGAAGWVHSVEGEYSNVVGLPVSLVKQMLGNNVLG